jgi:hypothetical protein
MKSMSKSITLILSILLLLPIAMLQIRPASAEYPSGRYYLQPSTYSKTTEEVGLGTRFNVTVLGYNFTESGGIWAYQFQIYCDPNMLNITRAWKAEWDSSWIFYGHGVANTMPAIGSDAYGYYAKVGETLVSPEVALPIEGPVILGIVEFNITNVPGKYETLTCSLNITNTATYWLGPTPATKHWPERENGQYTLEWAKPPYPHMAVDPSYVEFDKYTVANGSYFDVSLKIIGLSAAWKLSNVTVRLTWNDALCYIMGAPGANITIPNPPWGYSEITFAAGDMTIFANTTATLSGDVVVATIRFTVRDIQGTVPPLPPDSYQETTLDIDNDTVTLWDTIAQIPTTTAVDGKVRVYNFQILSPPTLEVSSATLGPEPVICHNFNVTVTIKDLHFAWHFIGLNFGIKYNDTLIEPVAAYEGPFLMQFKQNRSAPFTWFMATFESDGYYGPHVFVGNLLYPASWPGTGWFPPWVNGTGVVAIITFHVKYQSYPFTYISPLELIRVKYVGASGVWPDQTLSIIPTGPLNNGTVTILTNLPGRMIDVYGGAENRGYGSIPFPAPYGGQGLNRPMDLVIPQSVVYLFAYVTYNYWPVQSKDVGFEIEGPYDQETGEPRSSFFVRKYSNRTDSDGYAWVKFQMPWPYDNPEELFGKYKVTASVDICGVVVTDTLLYDYYYLVEITKVTTDKYEYWHCEDIEVTIEFRSKAQQTYPVLFSVVGQDELETHFDSALTATTVGGAQFCSWKNYEVTVSIHVVKWAFAGIAHIYVSAFDKDPTIGGAPWCPTYGLGWPPGATLPEICIQPYSY